MVCIILCGVLRLGCTNFKDKLGNRINTNPESWLCRCFVDHPDINVMVDWVLRSVIYLYLLCGHQALSRCLNKTTLYIYNYDGGA